MYFESHAHFDDARYNEDRDALLASMPATGVDVIINIGACVQSSKDSVALAEKYDYVYASVGVHPHEIESMTNADLDTLKQLSKHPKVVAVGEIGLDYNRKDAPKQLQIEWFAKQLELTKELGLPLIVHSRDATEKTFNMVKASGIREGVIHCYSSDREMAKKYVDLGFYIGVGGVVTFHNAKALVNTVAWLPLEHMLIETDCPYLAPVPFRGERNDSQKLGLICDKIAQIKQTEPEKVADETMKNGLSLFRIK